MFWIDILVEKLEKKKKHRVDDAWSTSGFAHIGSLRGAVIHQIAFNALNKAGLKGDYTFIMDDFDPMDGMPAYLDELVYKRHMGKPLFAIPSPDGKGNLAGYFANDFFKALKKVQVNPTILWTSKIYKEGTLNKEIKTALNNAGKIREIYKRISGSERPANWYPFSPVCEKCGKIGTTRVYDWDGERVSYKCEPKMVEWAQGCGYEGKISPLNGSGKLPWRVEWPARWKALGITVEGEGKDHWSAGGSREMADVLSEEVFKYEPPYDIRYDFFLIGGKKMSSSAARGITALIMSQMLPAPIMNYLLAQDPKKAIEFDPKGDTIPRLFDSYDRAREAYFKRIDFPDLAKAFEASQTEKPKDGYRMRFIKVAYAIQMPRVDIFELAKEEKGKELNISEKKELEERIKYAKKWLVDFAPEDYIFEVKKELPKVSLTPAQKKFLGDLAFKLKDAKWDGQVLHTLIHDLKNEIGVDPKEAFQAIYSIFLGKDSGPQAGWLLSSLERNFVVDRIKESIFDKKEDEEKIDILTDQKLFFFDKKVKEEFPELKVGFAVIKGVTVKEKDSVFNKYKQKKIKEIESDIRDLALSEVPELKEYRDIYRATGVDPTKKMPSPFALLKRLQQGKDLYEINNVVDAYNLVVMDHKISIGAFNLDKMRLPARLEFSKKSDEYLPLMAAQSEKIGEGELTFKDVNDLIICRSLNYRDSEVTKVDEKTKNLVIFIDGTKAISPEKIQFVLDEVTGLITKFAGGKIESKGVFL